jgi:hypothetical protein
MCRAVVVVVGVATWLAGCGDDGGVRKLPDAPPLDASDDASDDAVVDGAPDAPITITVSTAFSTASTCGLAFDHVDNEVLIYPCSGTAITRYSTAGAVLGTLTSPGEAANDVDLDIAPSALTLGTTAIAAGALLFANGETGVVELYAPETATSPVLATAFGASHVVGAAVHASRGTVFALQDRVPGVTLGNVIAELDAVTGAVINSFQTTPNFDVNYGDLDVCQSTGHLFVVSNAETAIAEFTPTGTFITKYPLPVEAHDAAGLGIEDGANAAWIGTPSSMAVRITGLPCD